VRPSTLRIRWSLAVGACCALLALAGCGSSSGQSNATGSTTGAPSSNFVDAAIQAATAGEQIPTSISVTGSFTPKPGGWIYNIGCDQSLVGCHTITGDVQAAANAIHYKYSVCNAASSDLASACFTDAINAKPTAIVTTGIGSSLSPSGWKAAKNAGIPIISVWSGNVSSDLQANVEIGGGNACVEVGKLLADGVIAQSDGKANILYLEDNGIPCDSLQTATTLQVFKECTSCSVQVVQFDPTTIETTLPQQVQAALSANPKINWVVAVYDQASQIAVTEIESLGKQDSIKVAGADANPANLQFIQAGRVQVLDVAYGNGEAAWSAVDAAARKYSGLQVGATRSGPVLLITKANLGQIPSQVFNGADAYQSEFKSLWGAS
jgi:ribose transport system substrate-binding protein